MTAASEILYATLGKRIAALRKQNRLSQSELAGLLPQKRTQAWISNIESGQRNISAFDLFEIASALDHSVEYLYATTPVRHGAVPRSLGSILNELTAHLPNEAPIYLQRDAGNPDADPVDFIYGSPSSTGSLFDHSHSLAAAEVLGAIVIERYYTEPRLEPTDLVTYNGAIAPRPNPDDRVTDRILVKLNEPYDGLTVHPCLITPSGDAETTITGKKTIVFSPKSFEFLGVLTLRRTLYLPSTRRAWLQRNFGIVKDERVIDLALKDES
jgi:transcriptional regulator with XRE-family HTH domain